MFQDALGMVSGLADELRLRRFQNFLLGGLAGTDTYDFTFVVATCNVYDLFGDVAVAPGDFLLTLRIGNSIITFSKMASGTGGSMGRTGTPQWKMSSTSSGKREALVCWANGRW